ncbi:uncharacterized protein LOC111699014 [Eurytemora carolleeae]|uniref:uncharacterized protein LOC111699014 n=1 Tax=Eurytemora carolleeae TaxID=1294199 RepID=UPI000C766FA1|nr:uncharacterized protein LOC111699014 [Eurytemora carolleeae]|eukprot:XP_023325305.1 uncharacterized protein LOC111699014 [Eurytemora affinis]
MAVNDLCSVSGILKLLQSVLIFITLLVHRHGDNGYYLFFATTGLKLGNKDPNIDYENLGNSTLVSFMIINLVLILGYVLDGPEAIHASLLEPVWNLLGACMFVASGAVTIITWQNEKMVDTSAGMTETEFYRNVTAALAMAGLCITVGALYLVDFIFGWVTRSRETDEYKNP